KSRKAQQRRPKVLHAGVGNANFRASGRGQPNERSDFDVVRTDAMRGASEWLSSLNRQLVRADAIDLRPERNEEVTEILNVRFTRGVAQHGRAGCRDRRSDRVLRSRNTGL